jgi:isoquinoline 1-oxidoreductase alpha subunit
MARLTVNGTQRDFEAEPDTPLLWVLREQLGLTGTKYGCGVAQCGFCQSGMLMAAAALLKKKPNPSDADIDDAMTNICRCGTYNRVRAAIKVAAKTRAA